MHYECEGCGRELRGEHCLQYVHLEPKDGYISSEEEAAAAVYEQLKRWDDGYIYKDIATMERLIDFKPITVTLFPQGAYSNYVAQRRAEGADMGHWKPPHINPSDKMLALLGARIEAVPEAAVVVESKTGAVAGR